MEENARRSGWALKAWIASAALTPPGTAGAVDGGESEQLGAELSLTRRQVTGMATNLNQVAAGLNRLLLEVGGGAGGLSVEQRQVVEGLLQRLPDVLDGVDRTMRRLRVVELEVEDATRRRGPR